MFEVDQYDRKLHKTAPVVPSHPYSADPTIERISFLIWGEHCTECSAPACYGSCDLYRARPDTRCRRFAFGINKNRNFRTVRGYGAEVSFKKWGVLGATGNTATAPARGILWAERLFQMLAWVLTLAGPVLSQVTRDSRWRWSAYSLGRRLCRWLHSRSYASVRPDAFVLEVFNPAGPVRFQIAMEYSPGRKTSGLTQIRRHFRATMEFLPGYSRHEFEHALFQNFSEGAESFLLALTPEADTAATLVFLTADFVKYKKKAQGAGPGGTPVKCVVWDLDNTLWNGVLVEHDNVRLRDGIREVLRMLDERGILSSIASKNDYAPAWKRLEELGVAEYFVAPHINWNPKSENVRAIARKLNISVDSLAFIDDNPFELAEVKTALPEVACISADRIGELNTGTAFQGSTTGDSRNRRRYYQEAMEREESEKRFGGDYLRFLEYSQIRLVITAYAEENFERVAELVQRTNQLNFSGRKYDRGRLRTILDDASLEKYVLSCSDRFGAYGLVGFAIVSRTRETIEVCDFMLSCRVQSRTIEQTFFEHLERQHNPDGAALQVCFTATARNQPARQALEYAGFVAAPGDVFLRDVRDKVAQTVVTVHCVVGCTAAESCATA